MYYILEIQEYHDGTSAVLHYTADTEDAAMSKWHGVLTYAALPNENVLRHSAAVLTNELKVLARESYLHPKQEEEATDESITEEAAM